MSDPSFIFANDEHAAADKKKRMGRPVYRALYTQVICALAIGAALGYFYPDFGVSLKPLADAFIKAIRAIITPIIFTTVVVGIARIGDMRQLARIGVKTLLYFEVVSTLALLTGTAIGNLYPFGAGIHADPAALNTRLVEGFAQSARSLTVVDFLLNIIPTTFVGAFTSGEILPVLFLAVLFGLALCRMAARAQPLIQLLDLVTQGLFIIARFIMYAAPFGAFGAIAFTVGKYGVGSLARLGELVAGVYIVSALFVIIVLGGALRLVGFSLWRVLAYFKDEILFVFCATSAETMIPQSMAKLESLGCPKGVVGFVMAAGFSLNMDGTAIYMTMAVIFIAQATNTHLSWAQQLSILFVMLFTSKGAAGVTGGGFVALAATLPTITTLPIGGLALLIGVDRFMAQIRAATNLTSNVIATLVVGRWVGAIDVQRARRELSGEAGPVSTVTGAGS
jgi:Na+/H+-dicarboxylate symporter